MQMTVTLALARIRTCTACTFSIAILLAGIWGYRVSSMETAAAAHAQHVQTSCRQFTAQMRKKPLHRYSASEIERLNSCNAVHAEVEAPSAAGF